MSSQCTVIRIILSKPVFAGLLGLLLLPWVILIIGIIMFGRSGTAGSQQNMPAANTVPTFKPTSFHEESVGPWGVLEIERMIVGLPFSMNNLSLSTNDFNFDPEPYRSWVLGDVTVAGARQMFVKAGVASDDADAILKTASESKDARGIVVRPPENIVRGFPPTVRAALYKELSRGPKNIGPAEPFRFLGDTIDEWFVDGDIPAKTIEAVRPLVYKRGKYLLFSDPQLVLPGMGSRYERLKLLGVLRRTSTFRLRIKARNEEEQAAIADYWGYPNRQNEIAPLLPAVAMESDGLSAILFLPVFARDHLYTYVPPSQLHDGIKRDCHWASFNFFNDPPDNRFAAEDIGPIVASEYGAVNAPARLGDVILLFNGANLMHSCVYIADDVVFTKNGEGVGIPFILDKLDNVVSYYQELYGPMRLVFCRRKASVPTGNKPASRK